MYRLLQNACIEYTGVGSSVRVGNPYLCFSTHIVSLVLSSFRRRHFRSYQFDTRSRHRWGAMKASKAATAHTVGVGDSFAAAGDASAMDEDGECQQGRRVFPTPPPHRRRCWPE